MIIVLFTNSVLSRGYKLLRKSINGPYRFEREMKKVVSRVKKKIRKMGSETIETISNDK